MYRETVECAACNERKAAEAMARRRHWGVIVGVVTFGVAVYGMSAVACGRQSFAPPPVPDGPHYLGSFVPRPQLPEVDPDPIHWSARDARFSCRPSFVDGRTDAYCTLKGEQVDSFDATYGLLQACEVDMDTEVHGHFRWYQRKAEGECPKSPPSRILRALGASGGDATVAVGQ